MKRTFFAVLTISLLLMARSAVAGPGCPGESSRNVILTEGTAEVTGQNDSARISVAVVDEGPVLEKVTSENSGKTKAVLKAIKDLNIRNLKLKTANYRVTPQKDYKARPPKIKGYEVHNAVQVTLEGFQPEDLSKHVSKIVGTALESGANNINHIQLYIENKKPLEKEALTLATQEAIERAKTLAEAAGVKLKRIASISTRPIHIPPTPHMMRTADMKAEDQAAAPPIETGESVVRVQVSLAYEIE
jgi:uncharacterized protein YggE